MPFYNIKIKRQASLTCHHMINYEHTLDYINLFYREKVRTMNRLHMNKKVRIISFVAVLFLIVMFTQTDAFKHLLNGEFSDVFSSDNMWVLIPVTMLLMIVQNLFTVIPFVLLISLNIILYGFTLGYIWSVVTSLVGATVCFYAVRFWFQSMLMSKVSEAMQERVERSGFVYVFLARIIPFVPTSLINIAAGVSTMPFPQFFISTLFGNIIYIFVLGLIAYGVMNIEAQFYIYIAVALVFIALYATYMRRKKRRFNKF